jgi:hypothetical protein
MKVLCSQINFIKIILKPHVAQKQLPHFHISKACFIIAANGTSKSLQLFYFGQPIRLVIGFQEVHLYHSITAYEAFASLWLGYKIHTLLLL